MSVPRVLWFVDGVPSIAWIGMASAQAAVLIVAVLALRALLGRHLTPGWRLALWLIVLLRLVVPLAVESRWNLASITQHFSATKQTVRAVSMTPAQAMNSPRVLITYGPIPGTTRETLVPQPPMPTIARVTPVDLVGDVWLAGFVLLVVGQAVGTIRLHRAIRRMRPVDDASLLAVAARCAREIGVRRRVRLVETDRLRAPAVCGIVWPTILLPVDVAASLAAPELRLVLLHEFAHVRRDDALLAAIAWLVRAFHWFNPLVWLGVAAFRADRELAADAAVLRVVGDAERCTYGECLLHVVERISGLPLHRATLGVFGSARGLRRRIDMIATPPSRSPMSRSIRVIAGTLIVVAIGSAAAVGEPQKAATSAPAATTTRETEEDGANRAVLDTPLPDLLLAGRTIEESVAALSAASHVPIHVEWTLLEAQGIARSTLVPETPLTKLRLGRTLGIAMQQIVMIDNKMPVLDFEVVAGGIVLSTVPDIATRFGGTTRTFNVSPDIDPNASRRIVAMIEGTIDPTSWQRFGGSGLITLRDGLLTVRATRRRLLTIESRLRDVADEAADLAEATTRDRDDYSPARELLNKPIEALELDGVALVDAVNAIAKVSGVPLHVAWSRIEAAGLSRQTPGVTLRLHGVTLAKAIAIAFDRPGIGGESVPIDFEVIDHAVVISTADDIVTLGVQGRALRLPVGLTPAEREGVEKLIVDTIESDSWKENGGIGEIAVRGDDLLVTQTPRRLAAVSRLLRRLSATRGAASPSTRAAKRNVAQTTIVPELRIDGVPFEDAIRFLNETTSAFIFVDWASVEAAGVKRTTPVTLRRARDRSLAETLSELLESAGRGTAHLGFDVDEGTITVTTQAQVDLVTISTRTYDVRDLLAARQGAATTRRTDAERAAMRARSVAELMRMLTETVEPDSWKVNGGEFGEMQELSGQLIVTQLARAHWQISEILDALRAGPSLQVRVATRLIAIDADHVPPAFATAFGATTRPALLAAGRDAELATLAAGDTHASMLINPSVLLVNGQKATITIASQPSDAVATSRPIGRVDTSNVELGIRAAVTGDAVALALNGSVGDAAHAGEPLRFDTAITVPDGGASVIQLGELPGVTPRRIVVLLVTPTIVKPATSTTRAAK